MNMEVVKDSIRGCLIGGAVGDALGWPIEFKIMRTVKREYGRQGITDYSIDFATGEAVVTDDTQMTLFTADGILSAMKDGIIEPCNKELYKYVHCAYLDWLATQGERHKYIFDNYPHSILLDIPNLFKKRGPGITCLDALRSCKSRSLDNPINDRKGCGGIMRVAPVGLLYPDANVEEIVEMAAEISAITHGHPLGNIPSGIFAAIIHQAVWGDESVSLIDMIRNSVNVARKMYKTCEYWSDLEALIDKAITFAGNDRSDEINLKEIGEGWVAEETLAVALYCALKYENDFDAGIIASVNHDGDSDSTGAVDGNILGAITGYNKIDDKWKEKLQFHDLLLDYADQCYQIPQLIKESKNEKTASTFIVE